MVEQVIRQMDTLTLRTLLPRLQKILRHNNNPILNNVIHHRRDILSKAIHLRMHRNTHSLRNIRSRVVTLVWLKDGKSLMLDSNLLLFCSS